MVTSKIDLNAKDNYGCTPFRNACRYGHVKLAEMLMKKSIELDIDLNGKIFDPAYDGWTAFHLACFFGKTDIVKIMIDNSESLKLDLTAKDKNKQTGFQLAQRNKQQPVVLLLHWNNLNHYFDFHVCLSIRFRSRSSSRSVRPKTNFDFCKYITKCQL